MSMLYQGRIQDLGGGVPRNFVNDNMWREAPLETPKASTGEGTEGGQWPPLRRGGGGGGCGCSPKKI